MLSILSPSSIRPTGTLLQITAGSTAGITALVCLLMVSGCKPSSTAEVPANADVASPDSVAVGTPEPSEPADQKSENQPDGAPVSVRGGLESVDWKSMVGREVVIEGDLVVVDTYDLLRRGQVNVARRRLYVPTSRVDPNDSDPSATSFEGGSNVAKVTELQKLNDNAVITLDDGSAEQNVFPPKLFPELGGAQRTVRVGSVIKGVSGKIVQAGNKLLLVPEVPLQYTPAERPDRPSVGDADVTVASFNVLNYFTTIDDGDNNARGADSQSELERQQAKLVSAITALRADVVGLMELENNTDAEERLVQALNKSIGKEVYKGCGIPNGLQDAPGGSDSIRVGIIYRSDRVSPVGDPKMIRDPAFFVARTPVVQTFATGAKAKPFTVIVNHFKSKGGADRADEKNKNKGDGQAAYNAARRSQSLAICKYIDTLKTEDPQSRVLVIGDLNAYQQEDPVDAMRAKGLIDLNERFAKQTHPNGEPQHYSYVYYGQSGSLDHALATSSLANDVTGVATWHINADEPRFLDYNEEFVPKVLFKPTPFRSSDHDPVLIGIRNR